MSVQPSRYPPTSAKCPSRRVKNRTFWEGVQFGSIWLKPEKSASNLWVLLVEQRRSVGRIGGLEAFEVGLGSDGVRIAG
ncbi:MAG: hypothetical protein H7227_00380 [Actinobacteria bacterium]|nr:hypothetical protein [Actinomycetota bacterium]